MSPAVFPRFKGGGLLPAPASKEASAAAWLALMREKRILDRMTLPANSPAEVSEAPAASRPLEPATWQGAAGCRVTWQPRTQLARWYGPGARADLVASVLGATDAVLDQALLSGDPAHVRERLLDLAHELEDRRLKGGQPPQPGQPRGPGDLEL
jgi:hypothetical protein